MATTEVNRIPLDDTQLQNARYEKLLDHLVSWIAAAGVMLAVAVVLAQVVYRMTPRQEVPERYSLIHPNR